LRSAVVRAGNQQVVVGNAATKSYTCGIQTVNLPANGLAAHVSISLPAGARNEGVDNIGAATFTRNCIGASNFRNTAFLQNKMTNFMGASLTTSGTRERTVVNISAGPKAIDELALDVVVPSIMQPVFFKWEMTHAWESAKNQAECPVSQAFHANSFKGGLANSLDFKGGYGSDAVYFPAEREEALEALAKNFHENNYGTDGAIVVGCGVSDELLVNIAAQLQNSTHGNAAGAADGFRAGELRIRSAGVSCAVVGADVTGLDAGAAAIVAASVGGSIKSYSDVQVLSIPAFSAADLEAKLATLSSVNVEAARADAALAQALALGSGDVAAVKAVAECANLVDVSAVSDADVQSVAAAVAGGAKSLLVMGNTGAFPFQSDL